MIMIDLTDSQSVEFAKFLLERGANPNICDLDGNTALHILAGYKSKVRERVNQNFSENRNESIKLLIK